MAKKIHSIKRGPQAKTIRRRRTDFSSYSSCILKVLKQDHPETGTSKKAMSITNSYVIDALDKIAIEGGRLVRYTKSDTPGSREIQSAVRLVPPGEPAKHAVSEGTKAVTKYKSSE